MALVWFDLNTFVYTCSCRSICLAHQLLGVADRQFHQVSPFDSKEKFINASLPPSHLHYGSLMSTSWTAGTWYSPPSQWDAFMLAHFGGVAAWQYHCFWPARHKKVYAYYACQAWIGKVQCNWTWTAYLQCVSKIIYISANDLDFLIKSEGMRWLLLVETCAFKKSCFYTSSPLSIYLKPIPLLF